MKSDDALVSLAVVENENDEMMASGELKRGSWVGRERGDGDCIWLGVSD